MFQPVIHSACSNHSLHPIKQLAALCYVCIIIGPYPEFFKGVHLLLKATKQGVWGTAPLDAEGYILFWMTFVVAL